MYPDLSGVGPLLDAPSIKLLILVYFSALVYLHMEYVHGRGVRYTRRFILGQLVADLGGFLATWVVLRHLGVSERWIDWFLGVHFVVHFASLGWALFHFRSLLAHMEDFQARRLHPVFQATEFLYEQSDTAMYLVTAALLASSLPFGLLVPLVMAVSAGVAVLRPTAGFHRPPADPDPS